MSSHILMLGVVALIVVGALAVASYALPSERSPSAWGLSNPFGWMMGSTPLPSSAPTDSNPGQSFPPVSGSGPGSGWQLECPCGSSSAYSYPSGTMGIGQAIALMKALPDYAKVNTSANTITYGSQSVSILVLAAMGDDAANITGVEPPNYATGDVFMVGGLIDPTLVFQRGANVNFTFVNIDDDMYHNFVLTTISPPYSYMMMASGGMGPGMMYEFISAMPLMAPANYQQGYAYAYSYSLTMNGAGDYWYVCTYPGHAQSGMYGEIITS